MQAIAALEFALKHKRDLVQVEGVRKKYEGLSTLLDLAIHRAWLTSDDIQPTPALCPAGGKIY
jgi:hypothetical protein